MGEAHSLTWNQVDMKNRQILITETESGEDRIIPINNRLFSVLDSFEDREGKLFHYSSHWVTNKFRKVLKDAKIEGRERFTVHSLRHTFTSHLVMEGTDLYTVSKLLGNSSVNITEMNAHLAPDYLRISAERIAF